jgi:hypothetical protein
VAVPGFSGAPEPIETLALLAKGVELIGVVLAFTLALSDRARLDAPAGSPA